MNTQWLESTGDRLGDAWSVLSAQAFMLTEPERARQVRKVLYAFAILWMIVALAQLIWNLFPQPQSGPAPGNLINPLSGPAAANTAAPVDIDQLVGWNLFGTAASKPLTVAPPPEEVSRTGGDLAGIENNAKETRLNLKLQGIVASTDPDTARAIIEAKRKQEAFAVGDKLPVSGNVTLAKILPDRVVISNGGKYELLLLFDKSSIASQPLSTPQPTAQTASKTLDKRGDRQVTAMAESYRKRLYTNPQSLSDVVKIAAVRQDGQLQGYRVSAGRDRKQFESLGFQANDIVTGVNGVELTDPGKAMELYRIMRSAEEASFNVLRGGAEVTLVVGLGGGTDSP